MVMKIYCGYCEQTWEVYVRDDPMRPSARKCPHCGAAMVKEETWKAMVDCLKQAEKINAVLFEDHINEHYTPFVVSYKADSPFNCVKKFSDV